MPITQASIATVSVSPREDHRIFGLDYRGFWRANLHNGPACPEPGAMYSWVTDADPYALARKLAHIWEQPLSEDEEATLDELEASAYEPIPCDECGETGVDPGGLSATQPEDCPLCLGTTQTTMAAIFAQKTTRIDATTPTAPARKATGQISVQQKISA